MKDHSEHIEQYMDKLGKTMCDYMTSNSAERYYKDLDCMGQCWLTMNKVKDKMCKAYGKGSKSKHMPFTMEDAEKWVSGMTNDDGTMGEHWTMEQTTSVAKSMGIMFDHISEYDWWACLNSMYSDYYKVAEKYGLNTPEFYGCLAKAFLFDKDAKSPKDKLEAYYCWIVKHGKESAY